MATLNWEATKALGWKLRNAAIEAALRELLGNRSTTAAPLSTYGLAWHLLQSEEGQKELSQILSRLAPHLQGFATHDGEPIFRYGRKWQRWNWRGQHNGEQT